MLKCCKCKKEYPKDMVYSTKQTHFNTRQHSCKSCKTEATTKRRHEGKRKKSELEASKRAYQNHKVKWIARAKIRYAVKIGKIKKPKKCEVCERIKPVQGHHEDYSKPLEVIWLCSGCHADVHKKLQLPLTTNH